LPDFFNAIPDASTRRSTDTSLFSRSISVSGILAMNPASGEKAVKGVNDKITGLARYHVS
jgi:hypothetical protein